MENKQQDRDLEISPAARGERDMNERTAQKSNQDTGDDEDAGEERKQKRDADSGNDSSNEMLRHEKLIDPGNEHNHDQVSHDPGKERAKHDADAGGDGTGTMGSKPE